MKSVVNLVLIVALSASLASSAEVKLPPYREQVLNNGLDVIVIENHELPVVQMQMVIKSGSAYDPQGKAGLANLTADLLRQGTKSRTATQIAEGIDFVGGSLGGSANRDATIVSSAVLVKHFDVAMELLADVILNPAFADDEIQRQKNLTLSGIKQAKDNLGRVAGLGFDRMLFDNHPYGAPAVGTEVTVPAITTGDIRQFYGTYYRPDNAIFVIAGDIKPDQMMSAVEQAYGKWESGTVPPLEVVSVKPPAGYKILLVDKPDASQANVSFGHFGITRTDPDYYPMLLMNYILGSSFTSRLYQVVRDQKGLTYDIRTVNEFNLMPAGYSCQTSTETESTFIAIQAAIAEMKRIRQEPVTDAEYEEAVKFYSGYYPMQLETPAEIASEIVKVKLYGLPPSYIEDFTENVGKVTKQQILDAAKSHLHPDDMVFSVVGNATMLEAQLKTLGPVTKISIDEF